MATTLHVLLLIKMYPLRCKHEWEQVAIRFHSSACDG